MKADINYNYLSWHALPMISWRVILVIVCEK